jgi:hypothetical protein
LNVSRNVRFFVQIHVGLHLAGFASGEAALALNSQNNRFCLDLCDIQGSEVVAVGKTDL